MTRTPSVIMDYYNKAVVELICEKYGFSPMDAFKVFASSEIHRMLSDKKYEMWDFGAPAIFDMWEAERITGNPRNSLYLRGDLS